MDDLTHWRIASVPPLVYLPWLNILCSWLAYLLFALIVHACYKGGVLRKRMHDVFPILIFALICDFLEMGKHVFFVHNVLGNGSVPTTVGACTLAFWLVSLHFQLAHIHAMISLRRFVSSFYGKVIPACAVYICLGIIFAAKVSYIVASFVYSERDSYLTVPSHATCTGVYTLGSAMYYIVGVLTFLFSTAIAPLFLMLTLFKEFMQKQKGIDVTAFILISSISIPALILVSLGRWLTVMFGAETFGVSEDFAMIALPITYTIEDFRFPILCLLATLIVRDIKEAVTSTVIDAARTLCGRKKVSFEMLLTSDEKYKKIEIDAACLP